MNAFEHVTVLLSFVYALALAHLLSRVGALLGVRERVRFSGLLALAMFNCVLAVLSNWLSLWDMRTVQVWDIFTITILFLVAIVVFALNSLVAPEIVGEGQIDLEAFYWKQRPLFYSVFIAGGVVALVANATFLESANAGLFFKENIVVLLGLAPGILAIAVRARWAQWVAGAGMFAVFADLTLAFDPVLR